MTAVPFLSKRKGKVQSGQARDKHRGKMPNPTYLLLTFVILLGATILVRTVAIAQHAYNVILLPSVSGNASAHLMAAVATPDTSRPRAILDAHPVEGSNLVEHHFPDALAEIAPDAESSAKRDRPQQIASERHRKKVVLRGHYRLHRDGFIFHRPWTLWWH
jgi:hypothetical protein